MSTSLKYLLLHNLGGPKCSHVVKTCGFILSLILNYKVFPVKLNIFYRILMFGTSSFTKVLTVFDHLNVNKRFRVRKQTEWFSHMKLTCFLLRLQGFLIRTLLQPVCCKR